MKSQTKVLQALIKILTNELTAINQYFLHARMCKDWGYEKIAKKFYDESLEEMRHARDLIDRILFLEGIPNVQNLHSLNVGTTIKSQLEKDLALEYLAISDLKESIQICTQAADFTSKDLLESILINEESHVDWIESQLNIINDLGEKTYLSQQFTS